jgi:UDP-N-acetyl-D-mannosaminuronate dehydrogenase
VLKGADCLALMVRHHQYVRLDLVQAKSWMRTPLIVDGRNALARAEGWIYRGVGLSAATSQRWT